MANGFGKSGFEYAPRSAKDIKLQVPKNPGETTHFIARIVPPMGDNANNPLGWAQFVKMHFGHYGKGRVPGKPSARPFACIEKMDFKTKEIKVHCPKCDQIAEKTREIEALEAALKTGSNQKAEDRLRELREWKKANSLSMGYRLYVVTPSDEIFRLQLSSTTYKNLVAWLKDYQDKKHISVIDGDGVFIDFARTGYGRDTRDTFAAATTTVELPNGVRAEVPKPAPISDALAEKLFAQPALASTVRRVTAEQIQALVDCDDSPEEVDRILGFSNSTEVSTTVTDASQDEDEEDTANVISGPPLQVMAAQPTPAPQPAPAATPAVDINAILANPALLAALQAQLASATQPAPTVAHMPQPTQPAPKPLEKSDEEFFAQFGK